MAAPQQPGWDALQNIISDRQELQSFRAASGRPNVRGWLQGLLTQIEAELSKALGGLDTAQPTSPLVQSATSSAASSLSVTLQGPEPAHSQAPPQTGGSDEARVTELLRRCGLSPHSELTALPEGETQGSLEQMFRVQARERQALAASSMGAASILPPSHGSLGSEQGALSSLQTNFSPPGPSAYLSGANASPLVPIRLDTCSFEQTPESLKVYVPLRGVQTEMLRTYFTVCSAEVKVFNLHGRNYIFTLQPTSQPIVPHACFAVASKTRKNILITLQKMNAFSQEERQWSGLKASEFWPAAPNMAHGRLQ